MPYKVGQVLKKEKGTAKQFTLIAISINTEEERLSCYHFKRYKLIRDPKVRTYS